MKEQTETLEAVSGRLAASQTVALHKIAGMINKAFGWRLDAETAVVKYLVERHHWLPRDVRSMCLEDLLLCLEPLDLKSSKRS